MARHIQTRKRSGGVLKRSSKKRKVVRRRRTTNGRTTTSRASGATSIGTFRTKKTSLRTWRNMLWRDTAAKTHYRSIFDATTPMATPNDLINATLAPFNALTTPFWTAAGGAQQADTGVAVPTFNGDIILRGGISRIAISNRPDSTILNSDVCRVTVYAVWTDSNNSGVVLPTVVKTMWDPSLFPDFTRYGKVMFKREALLKGDGEAVQVYFKYKPQKIDQAVFSAGGSRLVWMVLVSQLTNSELVPVAENLDVVNSHNISFSADAV